MFEDITDPEAIVKFITSAMCHAEMFPINSDPTG
jgi:hypothetical protein